MEQTEWTCACGHPWERHKGYERYYYDPMNARSGGHCRDCDCIIFRLRLVTSVNGG